MTSVEDNPTVTVAPPRGPPNPTLPRRVDAAVPLELQPPESVGRYDVGELLGHGGGGSVFVGHDHALDRDVAIKFVRFGGGSSESVRVLREARALARLSHPNIVNIYDYGRFDDTLYFVMELVAGPTLDQWHAEPRPWEQVLTLFIEIGRGLSAAHEANIVHRDFKPRNVIVAADGRPRILDFGLARLSRVREQARVGVIGDDDELTHDSVVQGTPKFMSPEQWSGGAVDGRTDQFSYCVCLFTALYGEPPYPRNAMLAASTGDSLPPLASAKSVDVPRTVRVALERGLRGDPADRWPSMDALLEVLTSSLRRRRRRVATYTSAAVIVGALSYAWTAGSEVACDSPRNDAPEFTDAQRDQMSAVFAATELPYARGTGEYVSRELRAFVSTWGEVAEEICLATARNELTKASRERRRACQVEQRLRFVATLDVLRETDAAALAGGAAAVASLPDPTECLAPIDDGVDDRVRDVVDRADLLRRAARLREALSVVDTALARDEALPDVLYVRARVHEQSGEYGLATTDLRQAYRLAESQGRDRIAAAAATALVRLLGYRTLRTDEASAFVVTAAAKLDRIVPQRHVMRAELAAAEGYLELGRGRPEGAVDAFRRAAEMRRAMGGEALGLASDLSMVAQALSTLSRNDEARVVLLEAGEIYEAALGPEHPYVGVNRLGLGNVSAEQDDFEVAGRHYSDAVRILEDAVGPTSPRTAAAYVGLADTLAHAGRHADAITMWRKALAVYDNVGDVRTAAQVRGNLGLFLLQVRDEEAAAAAVLSRAVNDLLEAVDEDQPVLADARFRLAIVRRAQGKLSEALALAETATASCVRGYGRDSAKAFRGRALVSTVLGLLGRPAEIVTMYEPEFARIEDESLRRFMATGLGQYADALREVGRRGDEADVRWRAEAMATRIEVLEQQGPSAEP